MSLPQTTPFGCTFTSLQLPVISLYTTLLEGIFQKDLAKVANALDPSFQGEEVYGGRKYSFADRNSFLDELEKVIQNVAQRRLLDLRFSSINPDSITVEGSAHIQFADGNWITQKWHECWTFKLDSYGRPSFTGLMGKETETDGC